MSYHAVDDVADAFRAAREFLFPFEWSRWWRLALIAVFVSGGGGSLNVPSMDVGGPSTGHGTGAPEIPATPGDLLPIVLGVLALAVLLALVFALVGAVLELVLIESLHERTVEIRRFFRRRFRQGVRLLLFRLGIGLLGFLLAAALVGVAAAPLVVFQSALLSLLLALVVVPLLLLLALTGALVGAFTTAFVVPVMVQEDRNPVAAWRRFWPVLRGYVEELAVYVVVSIGLAIARGIAVGIAVTVCAFLLLLPFGLAALAAIALMDVLPTVGLALLVVVGLLAFLSLLVVVGFVNAPVLVFLRYYGLLLLGDLEPELDLVAEMRETVRADRADDEESSEGAAPPPI